MALEDFFKKKTIWMGTPAMVELFIFIKEAYYKRIPERLPRLERISKWKVLD